MRCRLVFRCHLPSSVIHWPIAMAVKLSTKKVTRSQGNCNAYQGWILLPVPHQGHFVFSAGSRQGWFSLWIEWLFHATPALRNRHWFCHREWLVWWNNTCSHSMTQHEQQEWLTRQTSRVNASSWSHQIKGRQCDCIPWLFTACFMQADLSHQRGTCCQGMLPFSKPSTEAVNMLGSVALTESILEWLWSSKFPSAILLWQGFVCKIDSALRACAQVIDFVCCCMEAVCWRKGRRSFVASRMSLG